MKKITIILIAGFLISSSHAFLEESPKGAPAVNNENWLLKDVLKVSNIYNTPFKDEVHPKEARRSMSRVINGLTYNVPRYNHGLAHAVRQAYLAKNIVLELRKNKASTGELTEWLKKLNKEDVNPFIKKVQLLALYYRAGRQNEYSPSGGTDQEKARFDENMRAGAALFKEAAGKSNFFENDEEINKFAEALLHYEYSRQDKEFEGITAFVDQILYAAHILDLRRVTASWNRPPEGPKEMLKIISETLGFGGEVNSAVNTLNDFSGKYLKATGDRDAWAKKPTLSDEFFFQAYDPEMMLIKLNRVR